MIHTITTTAVNTTATMSRLIILMRKKRVEGEKKKA
jgi:hypothetical protein